MLRKWDSNNAYSTITGAVLTNETIDGKNVLKAVYTVKDGGVLDQDNTADGNIVDPVGIGKSAVGSPNTGLLQAQ